MWWSSDISKRNDNRGRSESEDEAQSRLDAADSRAVESPEAVAEVTLVEGDDLGQVDHRVLGEPSVPGRECDVGGGVGEPQVRGERHTHDGGDPAAGQSETTSSPLRRLKQRIGNRPGDLHNHQYDQL
jgi:hypothetical protein